MPSLLSFTDIFPFRAILTQGTWRCPVNVLLQINSMQESQDMLNTCNNKGDLKVGGCRRQGNRKSEQLSSPFREPLPSWSFILRKGRHQSVTFFRMYPNSVSYLCSDQHGLGHLTAGCFISYLQMCNFSEWVKVFSVGCFTLNLRPLACLGVSARTLQNRL